MFLQHYLLCASIACSILLLSMHVEEQQRVLLSNVLLLSLFAAQHIMLLIACSKCKMPVPSSTMPRDMSLSCQIFYVHEPGLIDAGKSSSYW